MDRVLAKKQRTLLDYERKLARVRLYIAQHLDEELDTPRLAGQASMSLFHFHRIYCGMFGETPADTVRRIRLQRACEELQLPRTSIEQIAVRAGYASVPAFARAFKRFNGMPPGRFRATQQAASTTSAERALGDARQAAPAAR